MMKKNEIRVGGGGMLLDDGKFAFYIDVKIQEAQFNFESLDSFNTEAEMREKLEGCMKEFPAAIVVSARARDFQIMEDFFEKWNIIKIIQENKTSPSTGQGIVH